MSFIAPDSDQQVQTIRRRLIDLIDERGLSQQQLSSRSGVSQPQLSRLVSGTSKDLPLSIVIKLAAALDVELSEVVNTTEFPVQITNFQYNQLSPGLIPIGMGPNGTVAMPIKDFFGHNFITGGNPETRATLIENLVTTLAYNNQAMVVIDSDGDLSKPLIGKIIDRAPERSNDVVLLDFNDLEWPIGINPLAIDDYDQIDAAVAAAKTIIYKLAKPGTEISPQADLYLEQAVRAICEANINVFAAIGGRNLSLLEIPLFFSDSELRRIVMEFCDNSAVRETFDPDNGPFEVMSPADQQEAIAPLLGAFNSLAVQESLNNIIGQGECFDFTAEARKGAIIIVCLPRALGSDPSVSNFIGSMIVSAIARSLPDFEEDSDEPIHLIINRFENYLPNNFAPLLAGAAKHGLCLTAINDSPGDLDKETLKAVKKQFANKIAFQLDNDEAVLIAKQIAGNSLVPNERDLEMLGVKDFWVKISEQPALRLESLADIALDDLEANDEIFEITLEAVVEDSRKLAATPRAEADAERRGRVEDMKQDMGEMLRSKVMANLHPGEDIGACFGGWGSLDNIDSESNGQKEDKRDEGGRDEAGDPDLLGW